MPPIITFAFAFLLTLPFLVSAALADDKPMLRDIYGTSHYFDEFKDDRTEAIVFVILDDHCPVVQKIIPKLIELHKKYNSFEKDRAGRPADGKPYPGDLVRFIGIYVKPDMGAKAMAAHAAEVHLPFRVLHDSELSFVKKFGISRLSEVTVLDPNANIQYQGPVDYQNVQGSTKAKANKNYLADALESMAAGQPVKVSKVPSVGCKIDTDPPTKQYNNLTYSQDIAPIVQGKCQKCHEEGAVGPMPLQSYQDVVDYSSMLEEVVLDERMPPWPAVSSRDFRHSETLTSEERLTFLRWLRSDMNEGEQLPNAINLSSKQKWIINDPDFVFTMPDPVEIPATGVMEYVYVPIAINGGKGFDEDRWIEAIETRPGAPEVVHHIQIHEYKGPVDKAPTPLEQIMMYGLSIENARLIGSYTPGNEEENARDYTRYLGAGNKAKSVGMKLTKGSNLMLEMHYTTNGTTTFDKSSVAIRFAKGKPELELQTWFPFRKRADMIIPSNVENHSLQDLYHFGGQTNGKTVLVHGVRPHLHTRGKNYRLELVDAKNFSPKELATYSKHNDVRGETVLSLPIWDFNWQHLYRFKEPILVTPDKAFLATAYWDNTEHNPRNPNFEEDVPWGQQTEQEMFNTLFIYEILEDNDPRLQNIGKR